MIVDGSEELSPDCHRNHSSLVCAHEKDHHAGRLLPCNCVVLCSKCLHQPSESVDYNMFYDTMEMYIYDLGSTPKCPLCGIDVENMCNYEVVDYCGTYKASDTWKRTWVIQEKFIAIHAGRIFLLLACVLISVSAVVSGMPNQLKSFRGVSGVLAH